ncbi:signal-transducing adaptor protein 2-like [Polyodon spathula]|uniref:signal-transducing adaptor protein 2-like n=1 Tax=Polyodon spathula TaxID=7913 RepID=UPI001B7E62DF|nr:signal-transducing adaptor protein 2-like [Polyodon spathula]
MQKQRPGRGKSALPPSYYEGFIEKKGPKEKEHKRYWTSLIGDTLFFFNSSRDTSYVEKLCLSGFLSLTDDNSRDKNLEAGRLTLKMRDGEFRLTVPSLEARELWKGFIYTVVDLAVPHSLTLLPGQIHQLQEVLSEEKNRRRKQEERAAPPADSPANCTEQEAELPRCFNKVSRTEAESLLEKYPDCGNLLLRPGRDGQSYAVSTRQELNGSSVMKHYRVGRQGPGYLIEVENPISCSSLSDVVSCFIEKTDRTLVPFILQEDYEHSISFVQSDRDSGEDTVQRARAFSSPKPPLLPKKPGLPSPRASLPILYTEPEPEPEAELEPEPEENIYLNDYCNAQSAEDTVKRGQANHSPRPPLLPPKPAPTKMNPFNTKTPVKPPVCLKPKPNQRPPSESMATMKPLLSQPSEMLLHSVTEELREKLLQRRVNLS